MTGHLGDANEWRRNLEAYREVIGDDPNLLEPGQRLRIPGGAPKCTDPRRRQPVPPRSRQAGTAGESR